ncbi:DNA-deoxyinosine glycosylase [Stenotrophomonas indicatrix]|uniref:DNA-deoxyinosine glycosylase n=1 Tax=Stenotrophomonas indicatrix TaxID=2045451 RepID=UPI002650489F|nr:DNA-deoxyinosine glycosylase [Stenotrophomonas indicatrix]MDN8645479.1 DNA-deoxyinosine glycosylase [Stenotrophomonas indicatrix]MDN8656244.1 DNA-deoxyinosine glycosylase [Stenotrophomonas indicatrix]
MSTASLCIGLPAQVNADCRVLLLGSMPGIASLQAQHYYAHPRNRFWPLLGDLCGFDPAMPYAQRLQALAANGVGLWDVIGRCERRGSLDADIVRGTEVANALPALIAALPDLQLIGCNGGAAMQAFQRWVQPQLATSAKVLALPSTSPANAAWSLPRLRQAWQPVAVALATSSGHRQDNTLPTGSAGGP